MRKGHYQRTRRIRPGAGSLAAGAPLCTHRWQLASPTALGSLRAVVLVAGRPSKLVRTTDAWFSTRRRAWGYRPERCPQHQSWELCQPSIATTPPPTLASTSAIPLGSCSWWRPRRDCSPWPSDHLSDASCWKRTQRAGARSRSAATVFGQGGPLLPASVSKRSRQVSAVLARDRAASEHPSSRTHQSAPRVDSAVDLEALR